jgi:hypothetical protein
MAEWCRPTKNIEEQNAVEAIALASTAGLGK